MTTVIDATATSVATPTSQAGAILALAQLLNVRVTASDGIVRVSAGFEPGDRAAYAVAESACNRVLAIVRQTRSGSVWGTDSLSVGGYIGLSAGRCTLNKSGVDKRVAKILAK